MVKIKEFIKDNKLVGYGLVAVLFVAAVVLAILFFPTQRSGRAVIKADKYLAAGEPWLAAKYYEKAVSITPTCTKAYYGLVYADLSYDHDKAVSDFEAAREVFAKYSKKALEKNKNQLIDAYNLVPDIYTDYNDKIDALLECYSYTDNSMELHPALADAYLEKARALEESNPEESLEAYEEALKYRDADSELDSEIIESVKALVNAYRSFGRFDEAYGLLEEYKDGLAGDYDSLLSLTKASEETYEEKINDLSGLYEEMEGYYNDNHAGLEEAAANEMLETGFFTIDCQNLIDYDDKVNSLVQSFTEDAYIYSPTGFSFAYTGIGCGIYTFGDRVVLEDGSENQSYYFYFGDYVNGKREGYGYAFVKTGDSSYYAFEGEWKDDKPNGLGILYENDKYAYMTTDIYKLKTIGNFTDGLADGEMTNYAGLNDNSESYFYGSYTANAGVPESIPLDTDDYLVDESSYEGRTLIGVLQSSSDGYDFFLPLSVVTDSKLGVFAFL